MTETGGSDSAEEADASEPIVEKGRAVSIVWLIPIVALIVGAYIAWDAI